MPTTPPGCRPASEYELFLALRPDIDGEHQLRRAAGELQQQKRTSTSKLPKPSVWHVSVLDLGKLTANYSGDAMKAIEAASETVARPSPEVTHEGFASNRSSAACVLT